MSKKVRDESEKSPKFLTKKSLGQHFLNNDRVPERMADAGNVKAGDIVLEIGPGTGALTKTLLKRGARVVAVEADERAVEVLRRTFSTEIANKRLTILHADIRDFPFPNLTQGTLDGLGIIPHQYKVVANIPYYLSGMLFRTFLETELQPSDLVFLVQKEVAHRIARDKKESLLSLSIKVFGDPQYILTVKRGNFTPPPKIDSAIIAVKGIRRDRLGAIPEKEFFTLIHAGFASKRKQLIGNLSTLHPRTHLVHIFSTLSIREDVRAEDLNLNTWLELTEALSIHS